MYHTNFDKAARFYSTKFLLVYLLAIMFILNYKPAALSDWFNEYSLLGIYYSYNSVFIRLGQLLCKSLI